MDLRQGVHYKVSLMDYVRDRLCADPSFSKGNFRDIIEGTPAKAWLNHPRFGGAGSGESRRADKGSAVHDLVTCDGSSIVWLEFNDFRTKIAQTKRDEAHENDLIPMLTKEEDKIRKCAESAASVISDLGYEKVFEPTLLYEDPGTGLMCRSRPDWIEKNGRRVGELKTATNADPSKWCKGIMRDSWYDVQVIHATECLSGLSGGIPVAHDIVVVELEPPYSTSVIQLDGRSVAYASVLRASALRRWRQALTADNWTNRYGLHRAELPTYREFDLTLRTGVVL